MRVSNWPASIDVLHTVLSTNVLPSETLEFLVNTCLLIINQKLKHLMTKKS